MSEESKIKELIEMLQTIFSSEEGFKIKNEGHSTLSIRTGSFRCLLITFDEPKLYIKYLSKCDINGTESLRRIEKVAKNIPYISLIWFTDGSQIELGDYGFDLATLKIITKGESWYNSLGYVSDNYEIEKSYNSVIRELSCIDFIEALREKKIQNLFKKNSKEAILEKLNKIRNNIGSIFTNLRNEYTYNLENYEEFIEKRIAEIDKSINYFREKIYYFENPNVPISMGLDRLWKTITKNENYNKEMCEWVVTLLEYIHESQILMYNQKLSKVIK